MHLKIADILFFTIFIYGFPFQYILMKLLLLLLLLLLLFNVD